MTLTPAAELDISLFDEKAVQVLQVPRYYKYELNASQADGNLDESFPSDLVDTVADGFYDHGPFKGISKQGFRDWFHEPGRMIWFFILDHTGKTSLYLCKSTLSQVGIALRERIARGHSNIAMAMCFLDYRFDNEDESKVNFENFDATMKNYYSHCYGHKGGGLLFNYESLKEPEKLPVQFQLELAKFSSSDESPGTAPGQVLATDREGMEEESSGLESQSGLELDINVETSSSGSAENKECPEEDMIGQEGGGEDGHSLAKPKAKKVQSVHRNLNMTKHQRTILQLVLGLIEKSKKAGTNTLDIQFKREKATTRENQIRDFISKIRRDYAGYLKAENNVCGEIVDTLNDAGYDWGPMVNSLLKENGRQKDS